MKMWGFSLTDNEANVTNQPGIKASYVGKAHAVSTLYIVRYLRRCSPASYFRLTTLDQALGKSVFHLLPHSIVAVEPIVALVQSPRHFTFCLGTLKLEQNTFCGLWTGQPYFTVSPTWAGRFLSTVIPHSYAICLVWLPRYKKVEIAR